MSAPTLGTARTVTPGRVRIVVTMLFLTGIWGTTWAAVKLTLEALPPFTSAGIRFLAAGFLLALLAWFRGRPIGGDPRLRWLWPLQAVTTYGLSYGLIYWAQQWVPSGLTAVLYATFPLWVALLAALWLPGERLSPRGVLGMVVAFAGIVVIFSDDLGIQANRQMLVASAVALLSPIGAAAAQIVIKRWGSGLDAATLTAVPMMLAGAAMAGLGVAGDGLPTAWPTTGPLLALLYLIVAGSMVTFSLYFWLLEHVSATRLSLIAYGAPVIAVTIGTVVLGEPLTLVMIAGGAMVILGVALTARPA